MCFVLHRCSLSVEEKTTAEQILMGYNAKHNHTKYNMEIEKNNNINFLDMDISRGGQTITTEIGKSLVKHGRTCGKLLVPQTKLEAKFGRFN
jgi:hypothetical protein